MSAEDDLQLLAERMDIEKASDIDDQLDDEQAADLALRKLVTTLGQSNDEADVGIVEATYRTVNLIDDMASRLAQLEDQIDKVHRDAQTARTMADRKAKQGDSVSKKDIARLKSRNELLRAAANKRHGAAGTSLTVGEVQDMAKPEHNLAYQTVKDAWDELVSDWDAFDVTTNEDGMKAIRMTPNQLDEALVKTVESDLGRDDLTKRLISDNSRGGR